MKASHERVIVHAALLDLRRSLKTDRSIKTGDPLAIHWGSVYDVLSIPEKDLLQTAIEHTKPRQPTWWDRQKEKFGW